MVIFLYIYFSGFILTYLGLRRLDKKWHRKENPLQLTWNDIRFRLTISCFSWGGALILLDQWDELDFPKIKWPKIKLPKINWSKFPNPPNWL